MRRALVLGVLLAAPALPAHAFPPAKPAAKPVAKPVAADVISEGKETLLVDHLKAEGPTLVLFYRPSVDEDAKLAEIIRKRAAEDGKVAARFVRLTTLDAPIAKQYEVTETPMGFVYDRNKNLLGKGKTLAELGPWVGRALRTARLKWVDESDPRAPEVYRAFGGGRQPVAEIMKTMSLQPEAMEMISELSSKFHFSAGFLPRRTHEMIAAYVSSLNKCKY
jgi:hypothetical protein